MKRDETCERGLLSVWLFSYLARCQSLLPPLGHSYQIPTITCKVPPLGPKFHPQHFMYLAAALTRCALDVPAAALTRGAYYQLRLSIFQDKKTLATTAYALVTFKHYYYNTLYMGLPLKTSRTLLLVQNAAACMLTDTKTVDSNM